MKEPDGAVAGSGLVDPVPSRLRDPVPSRLRDPILSRALGRHERAFPRVSVTRTEAGHFLQEEVPEVLAESIRRVASQI